MRLRPAAVVQNGERRYAAVKRRTGGHHRRTYEYKGSLEKNGNNFSSSTVVNNMDYLNNVTKYEGALRVAGQDELRKLNEVQLEGYDVWLAFFCASKPIKPWYKTRTLPSPCTPRAYPNANAALSKSSLGRPVDALSNVNVTNFERIPTQNLKPMPMPE